MSGHSKWAKVHRQKELTDQKKSAVFSRASKQITLAAKKGADPNMNFQLRLAIDNAKAVNMPKDNIDRAIAKAVSKSESLDEVLYEGYGPEGVAIIVEATTDNKNRLSQEIKMIFNKNGGRIGEIGSVGWMFERRGVIEINDLASQILDKDKKDQFFIDLIEWGALDVLEEENTLFVHTKPEELKKIKDKIDELSYKLTNASLQFIPKTTVEISSQEKIDQLEKIFGLLSENEDVVDFYTNAKL